MIFLSSIGPLLRAVYSDSIREGNDEVKLDCQIKVIESLPFMNQENIQFLFSCVLVSDIAFSIELEDLSEGERDIHGNKICKVVGKLRIYIFPNYYLCLYLLATSSSI